LRIFSPRDVFINPERLREEFILESLDAAYSGMWDETLIPKLKEIVAWGLENI